VVIRAGRICPGYAGKGIFKVLIDQIQKECTAPRQSFFTSDDNPATFKDSFLRTYQKIQHMVRIR